MLSPQIHLLERWRSRLEHRQARVPHIRQPLAQVRTDRHSQDHLQLTSLQERTGHGGAVARNLGRRRGRLLFHSWQCALPGLRLGSVASFSINCYLFYWPSWIFPNQELLGRGVVAPPHVEWEGRREGEGKRGQGGGGEGDGGQEGGGDGGCGQEESENVVDCGRKVSMRNKDGNFLIWAFKEHQWKRHPVDNGLFIGYF